MPNALQQYYVPPPPFKSLQHVSIAIPYDEDHASASISAVDMDKTFLIYSGSYTESPYIMEGRCLIELIDSTHVRATRYYDSGQVYVNCHVVEFTSGIKSIQRGVIDLEELFQQDATIIAVDMDKTFVSWLGILSSQDSPQDYCVRLTLLNPTTVRAYRAIDQAITKVSFEVVEFS